MSDRIRVKEAASLLTFLTANLRGWTRNKIKKRLQSGCVAVNGELVSRHDRALRVGDLVEVRAMVKAVRRGTPQLEILYSDRALIAINKPAGLLSVASAGEGRRHALAILRNQLSRPKRPVKLWPVHRLDRDTSGVLLFATSREIREAVAAVWPEAEKTYMAVVDGCPSPGNGTIDQRLWLDPKVNHVHVGPHRDAKRAVTHFETQRTVPGRALLKIHLETGRQHQIRAHLAWLGHPIIGDNRYGTGGARLGLHALHLGIMQPETGRRLVFEAPVPDDFSALLAGPAPGGSRR